MRILVTGACGFVARHLCARLIKAKNSVTGADQWPDCPAAGIDYRQVNLLDAAAVHAVIAQVKPDRIYHLAGISYLPDADATPRVALDTNILGAVSLLDAMQSCAPAARLLLVGSSKEYGAHAMDGCLAEESAVRPTDFYGISKLAAELIGLQYARQMGLDVRCTRSFNHTGPGQSPRFVCSEWAKRVAEIELGKAPAKLEVGDISHDIDFTDVRDVVDAYIKILENGVSGEVYNVCSGNPISLERVLTYLCAKTSRRIRITHSTEKKRSHKTSPRLCGDYGKLSRHTGWRPLIPIEKTLDDLFDYWMESLRAAHAP